MKVLAISDHPSQLLWGPGVKEYLAGVELILSCGDLPRGYLEYLVTLTNVPLVYVHGNHDGREEGGEPEGCICAEDKLITVKGLRILGLGGCIRYHPKGRYQYTQTQMKARAQRQRWALHRSKGLDVLLTHSAAFGLGDGEDWAHQGFTAFVDLMDRWQPSFLIHGHSHLSYDPMQERLRRHGPTQIINAYERVFFEA